MTTTPTMSRTEGLDIDLVDAADVKTAATIFHRDGFVAIQDALTAEQLAFAQAGAQRIIAEQTEADPKREGNRGHHRYSFGPRTQHPEWAMLLDLPHMLAILDEIWQRDDYTCTGAGGDYSLPGAEVQPLHADMGDYFNDPWGTVTFRDIPAPFIVINYTMTDFTKANGAIRFIPCTQRSRAPIPKLDEEPRWMRQSIVCAPAGTAIVRDVRCWHGGTANTSDEIRPMTSAGYVAPWFQLGSHRHRHLPRALYDKLSERGKTLCADIVMD